jgi:uncharacterized protein (DUF1778 family)
MPNPAQRSPRASASGKTENLMIRVDLSSKRVIAKAARLRGVSTSDYVRSVVVSQARREVKESQSQTLSLSPEDQLAFWRALSEPVALTRRQRALGKLMRGER